MAKKEIIPIDSLLLNKAEETILSKFGLDFSGDKMKDLNSALINSAKESGNINAVEFTKQLIDNRLDENGLDNLLKNLTVGETYFFRDEKLFDALQSEEAKFFFEKKDYLNIWSAGCASGEEPYSIAILIDKLYGKHSGTKFNISASDINKHVIDKARKGVYREWSFRSTPHWVKSDYFSSGDDGLYEINERIKNKVNFEVLNLSDFNNLKNNSTMYDIIICRNVLIYFSKPLVKDILEIFYSKLNHEGIYITTASESININKNYFSKFLDGNNAIFIKKNLMPDKIIAAKQQKIRNKKHENIVKKNISIKRESKINYNNASKDFYQIYLNALSHYAENQFSKSFKLLEMINSEFKFSGQNVIDEAELYYYLIKNSMKLGNHKMAQSRCETALKKFNLDYRIHYLHGILLQENGEFDEAEEAFGRSIYLNNKFPLSFFELANLQLSTGKNSYKRNFQKTVKMLLGMDKNDIIEYSDGISAGYLLKQITQHTD